jgi:hypothetical protein
MVSNLVMSFVAALVVTVAVVFPSMQVIENRQTIIRILLVSFVLVFVVSYLTGAPQVLYNLL